MIGYVLVYFKRFWLTVTVCISLHYNMYHRSCEKEVITLQFFCTENRVNDWLNHWKRQRLVWWRRIANVRSNYSLHEEQSDLGSGVDNQTFIQVSKLHGLYV